MGNNVSTSLAALPTSVIQSTLTGPASASYLAELGQGVQYERSSVSAVCCALVRVLVVYIRQDWTISFPQGHQGKASA